MTTYRRTLSTIAAAAIAVAVAVAAASAGPGQSTAGSQPSHSGPGRGGFGGPFPMLRQLNLTDAQRQQIKALVEEERTATAAQSPLRTRAELQRALHAAILADTPDSARIDELRANIAEAEAASLAKRVELQLKVAQILTPEQRKQAREHAESRSGPGQRFGRRGFDFGANR